MKPYFEDDLVTLYHGDCITVLYDFRQGDLGGKVVKEKYLLFGYSTMDRTTKTCMISKKVIEDLFYDI